ncbi:MAG: DUF502 domain-containing protein [Gemmatimonadaceae bacterium]
MRKLLNYFLRGLVFIAPLAITIYACVWIFTTVDQWLNFGIPGLGFAVTIVLITAVGFLASNLLTRGLLGLVETLVARLPFVRLLYSSTKDLLNAFVGEKRRFDTPVMVSLVPGGVRALGFVTQPSLERLGLATHVGVYFPQSYNFAGQVLMVPADQIVRIDGASSDVMAFIVSGGVTSLPRARDVAQRHATTQEG